MAKTENWASFMAEGRKAGKTMEQISDEWKALKEEPRLKPDMKPDDERLKSPSEELPSEQVEEDYLRQYQYRKQTVVGSVESDPRPGSKAATMKKFLLSQPKVRMLIPGLPNEDPTIKQIVNLNGYRLDLPKNTYVDVPLQVAEVLGESLKQTNAALQINRIDGNKTKEAALL